MLVSLVAGGCGGSPSDNTCQQNSDCLQGGVPGECTPSPRSEDRYCAYPDPSCPDTQLRWGVLAGDNLESTCVIDDQPDAGMPVDAMPGNGLVVVDRQGTGRVTSTPSGIDCGDTCTAEFPAGTSVFLTAEAEPLTFFDGWGGDCTGASCTLSVDATRTVSATFLTTTSTRWLGRLSTSVVPASRGVTAMAGFADGDVAIVGGLTPSQDSPALLVQRLKGATGEVLWSKEFAGNPSARFFRVTVDSKGDVVVTGVFNGSMSLGELQLSETDGSYELGFLAKLSGTDGQPLWLRPLAKRDMYDFAPVLVVPLPAGGVVVSAHYVGPLSLAVPPIADPQGTFLARFDADGEPLWVQSISGAASSAAMTFVASLDGIVVAGDFSGSVGFDRLGGQTTDLVSTGGTDVFVSRHALDSGAAFSAVRYGSESTDAALAVVARESGNVLLVGSHAKKVDVGGGLSPVDLGTFVREETAAGTFVKALSLPVHLSAVVGAGALTVGESLWIAGYFSEELTIGSSTITPTSSTASFIAKVGADLVPIAGWAVPGTFGNLLAQTHDRQLIVSGTLSGVADFNGEPLTAQASSDAFLWSIVP